MRAGFAAAALAALTLAVPAAAQPDAGQVLRDALGVMAASHPAGVEDYTFTLAFQGVRVPMYVARNGDEWEVSTPEGGSLADLVPMMVMWPMFVDAALEPEEPGALDAAVYVRGDRVEGHEAHVITADLGTGMDADGLDSVLIYIDARTHHVLRMHVAGVMDSDMGEDLGAGEMEFTVDMLDHQETDGLVIPRRVRTRLRMEPPEMDAEALAQAQAGIDAMRAQLQGSDDPDAQQALLMINLFSAIVAGDEIDLPMTVEEVRINTGPPDWFEGE